MSFDFLAPDRSAPEAAQRSPIELLHVESGATLGERAGWSIVTSFGDVEREASACRTAVGVADMSFMGKIEIQGSPDDVRSIVSGLAGGEAPELGSSVHDDGVRWCPMTAGRVIAITPPERTAAVRESLQAAAGSASSFASVTELTAALCSNGVAGPLARECFARATALDMRPEVFAEGAFAPVSVARTPGMLLREGDDRFLHLFGTGYAQYNWTVFTDAAEGLGGRAVGTDALEAAREATAGA